MFPLPQNIQPEGNVILALFSVNTLFSQLFFEPLLIQNLACTHVSVCGASVCMCESILYRTSIL